MLFITLGDPHSITIAVLQQLLPRPYPIVIIGSAWHWQEQAHNQLELTPLPSLAGHESLPQGCYFYDIGQADCRVPTTKLTRQQRGTLANAALYSLQQIGGASEQASSERDPQTRQQYGVLTCPIDKQACASAGFSAHGQTEFFAQLHACETIMVLSSAELNVGLVTNHLAVRELPAALTTSLVQRKLRLFAHTLSTQLSCRQPRIAVCGFNPHCGDGGLCGDEEARIIAPAIAAAHKDIEGTVTGPHAADSIFYAARTGKYDGVLAMYHDQGLAPLKACANYDAVNITGGLPILRIAPDHGPAADVYGTDKADPQSFVRCFAVIDEYLSNTTDA